MPAISPTDALPPKTEVREPGESSLRFPGWRVAFASSACVFVSFASLLVYTFGVFLKPLSEEFHWSRQAVSAAFGFAALSVAAASPFLGMLLDRFPARRVILPCMAIFGSAFISLSFLTPHLAHLYGVFVVLGLAGNGTAHLAYTRALSTWFDERRGMAFATLMSGGALGAMVLPPAAQALIYAFGWRHAFAILGGMVLLVGLPLGSRVRANPAPHTSAERQQHGVSLRQGLGSWIFWIVVAVLFASSLSQNGSIAHVSALLTDRGVAPRTAALAMSVLGAATLFGRLIAGWLLDRLFAPRVSFGLMAIASLGAFLLAHAHSAGLGFLSAALIGFGMGAEADITPYLLAKYFGLRAFSTLYGLTWTAYAIAGAIGPVLMGKAFDLTGSYERLLSGLAALTVGTALLMLLLPRYKASRSLDTPA